MVNYRDFETADVESISKLILSSFREFVAYEYSEEGINEFTKYVMPEAINNRAKNNHFLIIAEIDKQIIGVIEIRDWDHISLLFVDKTKHGQGIAKTLWDRALEKCSEHNSGQKFTVNSSKFALPIYEKFGFVQCGEYQIRNGIGFIPMIRPEHSKD